MKHIKKVLELSMLGGLSAITAGALVACSNEPAQQQTPQAKGAFVIIEEVAQGEYKIKDQYPSDETRVILQQLDGVERILSKEEMDALLKAEEAKIDNGTSKLTGENAQLSGGGLTLGEALLASAAGAIIGSYIGSKLFNNPNFSANQRGAFSNQSAYQRSVNSFNQQGARAGTTGKSGFFGGGSKAAGSGSSFGS